MEAKTTAIAYVSRALFLIGASSISSFEDATAEAEAAAALYPAARDAMLSSHPWNFAVVQRTLAQLTVAPVADFEHAYQLPSDYLRALSVGTETRGAGTRYRVIGTRLHSDWSPPLVLTYLRRVPEDEFPAFFAAALVAEMAAQLCIPITDNTSRAEMLRAQADVELRRARNTDAQENPPRAFNNFPLIDARFG
jgi:hypothetical protein